MTESAALSELLPDAVVRYAAHDSGVIDLHLPSEPASTLIFLVHGGFWKQHYDRTHTRAQARALALAGYLVATPEYRRVGGGGGWPVTGDDVAAAYEALPGLLHGLGLTHDRVVTMGHSAGGHLVLWLAAQDVTAPPARTVALAPVADLALARSLSLGSDAVDALLGGADLAAADPNQLLTEARDVVLVHGDRDDAVPVELARSFVAAHPWADLVELPDVGHYEFLDPTSAPWHAVTDALGPAR
ncbi:MAG: alpha/beta hydrolase [Marmoricola sp.]|nr:alpha/beta hydrolase [Marmoricola sp.]